MPHLMVVSGFFIYRPANVPIPERTAGELRNTSRAYPISGPPSCEVTTRIIGGASFHDGFLQSDEHTHHVFMYSGIIRPEGKAAFLEN